MLKLVTLAVLVISSTCFQEYTRFYDEYNIDYIPPDITFPDFQVIPINPPYEFSVNRYSSIGKAQNAQNILLFFGSGETRLIVKFEQNPFEILTVISRVFIPPNNVLVQQYAAANAVHATSLTLNVPQQLEADPRRTNKRVICDIDWIVDILEKKRPRFLNLHENDRFTELYVGAPVIVEENVLQGLKDVSGNGSMNLLEGQHDRYSTYRLNV